jgi:hypothetical protein
MAGPTAAAVRGRVGRGCQAAASGAQLVSKPPCQASTKFGLSCRAPALPGSDRCWAHDPRQAEAAARARSEGGAKASRLRSLEGKRRRLDSPRALAGFLSNLVHDLVEGKVEAELVKTVAYSISVQCKVLDLARGSDLDRLRDELRAELAEARRRRA